MDDPGTYTTLSVETAKGFVFAFDGVRFDAFEPSCALPISGTPDNGREVFVSHFRSASLIGTGRIYHACDAYRLLWNAGARRNRAGWFSSTLVRASEFEKDDVVIIDCLPEHFLERLLTHWRRQLWGSEKFAGEIRAAQKKFERMLCDCPAGGKSSQAQARFVCFHEVELHMTAEPLPAVIRFKDLVMRP